MRLELGRKAVVACLHDSSLNEDVHLVRVQLVEQPHVVGDREHAEVLLLGGRLDPSRGSAEGVDVESGVELVEDRDRWLEDGELDGLVALLLAAGQVDVQRTDQETLVEPDALGLARPGSAVRSVVVPPTRLECARRPSLPG